MSKRDEQFRTHLRGHTSLSQANVFEVAKVAATGVSTGGVKLKVGALTEGSHTMSLEMRSTGMAYAFRGINAAGGQGRIMVYVGDEGVKVPAGTRSVLVHLDGALSSHLTVMFVPVTPKKIIGFDAYSQFLSRFGAALSQRDSAASVEVTSQEQA